MHTPIPDFYRYALHPTIPGIAFTVLVGAVLTLSNRSNREPTSEARRKVPVEELVVLAGFLMMAFLAFLVARFYTGVYVSRYSLPAVIGLAGLFSLGVSALWRERAVMGPVLLLVFGGLLVERNGAVVKRFAGRSAPSTFDARALSHTLDGGELLGVAVDRGQPIAINHFQPFVEFDYYASPKLASSLFCLTNPEAAAAYTGASMFDTHAEALARGIPVRGRIEKYSEFVESHKRFLVFHKPWGTDWLVQKLLDDGARLELIENSGSRVLYQVVFEGRPGTERMSLPPRSDR